MPLPRHCVNTLPSEGLVGNRSARKFESNHTLAKPTKKKRKPAKKTDGKAGRKPSVKAPAIRADGRVGETKQAEPPAKKATVGGAKKPQASQKKSRKPAGKSSARKPFWKRWTGRLVKWCLVAAVLLSLIPVLLTLVYWPSFVHPISSLMVSKWFAGESVKREWVKFEEISPHVWQSVMMSEDGRYCFHSGVDWNQVNIVVGDVLEGGRMRGASTISMQSVKNLYLWSDRSFLRKILEVPLAMLIDAVWGKKRLMEIYLNIAEWGPGIYGIGAASRHHFKRSAGRLSRRQAALLAVTLPNPKVRNPRKPTRHMRSVARVVERRAKASGAYIGCLR